MTTMEITVPEGTAEGARLLAALRALGAAPVREGGMIRATVPASPCAVCKEIHARHEMEEKPRMGGPVCPICMETARKIWNTARWDAHRHLSDVAAQLPQMVRDVRGGADAPTFYAGFPG